MSRKTSGALQIQLQTVVQALEAALSNLIEKVDALGTKIDKMPNVAKKMADGYVASFGTIAKSVEGLSSHVNKLDKIASGLTKIADGVKHFKATETQAKSIDRLTASFAGLGPAVAGFPKDVSGLTAFADSITSITKAFEGLDGKIPTVKQIGRLNSAANAIRNLGNAIKTTGKIPPDALAALKEVRGTGGGGGGTGGGPAAESSDFKQYATKGIGVALSLGLSLGLTEVLKRQNVNKELSQVMAFENSTIGNFIPGSTEAYRPTSSYTAGLQRNMAIQQMVHGINYEDATSHVAATARYTAGGNRAYGDVRTLDPEERIMQQGNLIRNSKLMNQMTGMDMSTAANMQLYMGRDLGIRASEYGKIRDAFIAVQRAGSLTAKDLEKLSATARDSGMALGLVGDEASSYITERLKSATALATAGIKASDTQGAMAGFFGDEKSFIFDLLAGVTDEDYKKGNEANILKKQYSMMGFMTAGMGNDRYGNLLRKQFMGEYAPATMQGGPEQYWAVSGRMGEVSRHQERLDMEVATNKTFRPVTTAMEELSMAGQKVVGTFGLITAMLNSVTSFGKPVIPPNMGKEKYTSLLSKDTTSMMLETIPGGFGSMLSIANLFRRGAELAKPEGKAQGGVIKPGASGATDSVPIMVTPGEEVLNANDPRHRNNLGDFTRSFAQIEGYYAKGDKPNRPQRNLNPGNLRVYGWSPNMDPAVAMEHARTQGAIGYDPQGYLKFGSEAAGFKGLERQIAIDAKRGLDVSTFIEKYAPATENNTVAYKEFIRKKGFGGDMKLADISGKGAQAPSLVESAATNVFSGLSGLIASQKAQQQAPLQLDPSVMSALSNIASSNSDSSDTMAQAVSMFAQVIQRLVSNSRSSSGGSDLAEAVARGNYAFSRGA